MYIDIKALQISHRFEFLRMSKEKKPDVVPDMPSRVEKVVEKGGEMNACLIYLREKAEKEEKMRLKELEHELRLKADEADRAEKEAERAERAAVRTEQAAAREAEEKEKERQLKCFNLKQKKRLNSKNLM